jgi:hypothetical protein
MPTLKTCLVASPMGIRIDPKSGRKIDFNEIYFDCIKPAVESQNITCSRFDELNLGAVIHKATIEALAYSDVVISDLTFANPNVLYELGIRHALRRPLWSQVERFIERELNISTIDFESQPQAGESIVPILEGMLQKATFAVLILTAEDETVSGDKRARQNVIHEAGLFQGLLGFRRAIILRQEGVEEFSNIAGLQYISFAGNNIDQTFWPLRQVLKREGMLSNL